MKKVEFRLFQLVLSHVSGDRVTLALLHWDGRTLRFASSEAPLKALSPDQRLAAREVLRDVMRKVRATSQRVAKKPRLDLGLAELFPVRQGFGASLYWSPVTAVRTDFAEAHFANLREELRLDSAQERRERRVTAKLVHRRLSELGEQIRAEVAEPDRVRSDQVVAHLHEYTSPLSWKNGVWHHAIPLSLDGLDPEAMKREVRDVVGRVELAIPPDEIPVVVSVLPQPGDGSDQAERERLTLEKCLGTRVEFIDAARCPSGNVDLNALSARVRADVSSHHDPSPH